MAQSRTPSSSSRTMPAGNLGMGVQENGTLLMTISKTTKHVRIGLLPIDLKKDSYHHRAQKLGTLSDVSHVFCNPEGELFCIHKKDLYTGPLPSKKSEWLSNAKRVGKSGWNQFNILLFHPNGELYGTTNDGELYKGPKPNNENVPWMCRQATKIGNNTWNEYRALFFDASGNLHTVDQDDNILKGNPTANQEDTTWPKVDTHGWLKGIHFMSFCSAGNLWCVDKKGDMYKVYFTDDGKEINFPDKIGKGFDHYKILCFVNDKTVDRVIDLNFLVEKGKIVSEVPEILKKETYDNKKSTVPQKHSFAYNKTLKKTSTFTHTHGFQLGVDIPFPVKGANGKIFLSTTYTLAKTKTDETQETYGSTSTVEVPPGKKIQVVASLQKTKMSVPFRAKVITLFGFETEIEGMWHGVDYYDEKVTQEDCN